jgi:hypothetical protein
LAAVPLLSGLIKKVFIFSSNLSKNEKIFIFLSTENLQLLIMSNHSDLFTFQSLPPESEQPYYSYLEDKAFFQGNELNCVNRLLDDKIKLGNGENVCMQTFTEKWTYQDLYDQANQIAHVLVEDFGLQSGNRVLLRSANNPLMVACWFAILKAGGVVVATMPLLAIAFSEFFFNYFGLDGIKYKLAVSKLNQ